MISNAGWHLRNRALESPLLRRFFNRARAAVGQKPPFFEFEPVSGNRPKFDRLMRLPPAERTFIIVFTPRSGSSWVTRLAEQTGVLSQPGECFHPGFMPAMTRFFETGTLQEYVAILRRKRATAGLFGFEVTMGHVTATFGTFRQMIAMFPEATVFSLIREDVVAQAVSLLKMQQTQVGHRGDGDEARFADAEELFHYDPDGIRLWIRRLVRLEAAAERAFDAHGITPHRLSYERNVALGAQGVLDVLARKIGDLPPISAPPDPPARRTGSTRNDEFSARFRQENSDWLAGIAAQRGVWLDKLPPVDGGEKP